MGGNALKNTETKRLGRDEYFKVSYEVATMLCERYPQSRVEAIQAYEEKETFGDLDIILETGTGDDFSRVREDLKEMFKPNEMVPNGKVISFDYKQFQVDVILTPKSEFEFARHYYAYNDLGNLMGRVAHKFGLKYGHNGLWFMYRDGDYLVDEICVSMDVEEVFKFLDFNYTDWTMGFETLEDVFNYVHRSKYFNPTIYSFENMNHRSRVRDQKRKTYNSFLDWIDGHVKSDWKDKEFYQFKKNKSDYIRMICDYFPGFEQKYLEAYYKMLDDRELKTKFNGTMVSEQTGYVERELGEFMKYMKSMFKDNNEFRRFVRYSSPDAIFEFIELKKLDFKKE